MKSILKEDILEFANKQFLNDKFIDSIIKTKKFCSHGSSLDDCYELFEDFEDKYPNALKNDRVLKQFLYFWIPLRINYIANEIISELDYYKQLHRQVFINQETLDNIKKKDTVSVDDIGVYWSSLPSTDSYNIIIDESNKDNIWVRFSINYDFNLINWKETLISRIDYLNGDQEQEFQLEKNNNIKILEMHV